MDINLTNHGIGAANSNAIVNQNWNNIIAALAEPQNGDGVLAGTNTFRRVRHNWTATVDPVAGDDSADGYNRSSLWYNVTDSKLFVCTSANVGAAVWVDVTGGGGGGGGVTDLTFTRDATTVTVESSTGTDAVLPAATTTEAGVMSAADKTKLDGVASGATANDTDANLLNRANHTGTQPLSTLSQSGATTGQVPKWNGTAWVPDNDNSGSGSTDLTFTRDATTVTVESSTGTDAVLPVATTSLAGVMSAADKTRLDNIPTIFISTNTTWHVSTAGNDTTGDGSIGAPWATIAKAATEIGKCLIPTGVTLTLKINDGTYGTANTQAFIYFKYAGGGNLVVTKYDAGTDSSVQIYYVLVFENCKATVSNITPVGLWSQQGAGLAIGNCRFKSLTAWTTGANQYVSHISANTGARIDFTGTVYSIDAGTDTTGKFVEASDGSVYCGNNLTFTASGGTVGFGTVTPYTGFAFAFLGGSIVFQGTITTSGAFTGARYSASGSGRIHVPSGSGTYFPGDASGLSSPSAYYGVV